MVSNEKGRFQTMHTIPLKHRYILSANLQIHVCNKHRESEDGKGTMESKLTCTKVFLYTAINCFTW